MFESLFVLEIFSQISASASENPANSRALGDAARRESLGLLLPLAVWTMWTDNGSLSGAASSGRRAPRFNSAALLCLLVASCNSFEKLKIPKFFESLSI